MTINRDNIETISMYLFNTWKNIQGLYRIYAIVLSSDIEIHDKKRKKKIKDAWDWRQPEDVSVRALDSSITSTKIENFLAKPLAGLPNSART